MGLVEVCTSVDTILSQLEKEKRGLQKIDEHIKKSQVSGRFQNERNQDRSFQGIQNDGPRGGGRNLNRNFYSEAANRSFDDDNRQNRKRPQETKTVFSRLSGRLAPDSDGEDEVSYAKKPRVSSQVIRELPTKQEVLKAQTGDEVSKVRNRRMFGSLLGTLQKFKQEEIILKNKEEKKAQIEKKIEEQAKQEKENQKRERLNLFAEREMKKAAIKALEAKMIRLESYEVWEKTQKPLLNCIQTKWKPHIYWLPKKMNPQATEKFEFSKKKQEKIIEDKQQELKEELEAIEQKCLRNMKLPPGMKKRPTTLSETIAQGETVKESAYPEKDEEDGDASPDARDEEDSEDEDNEEVFNIKQEKDTEKKSKEKSPRLVNIKIEKDKETADKSRKESQNKESDSSSDSSSSSSDSDEDKEEESTPKGIVKREKTEENGDVKKEKIKVDETDKEKSRDNPSTN